MISAQRVAARYIQASGTVVLPQGSVIYHGSLEAFSGSLRPGGDGLVWFTDTPAIAQLYIPKAGLTISADSHALNRPSMDPQIQQIQALIGIHFDVSDVKWDYMGRATSFPGPKGWPHLPTEADVERLLGAKGYEKNEYRTYEFGFYHGHVLPPGGAARGRLFIAKTKRDLRLWAKARGEGDLMDVDYNDIRGFKDAESRGLDGVLIDDFAQSKEWGNLGHLAVGLFRGTVADLTVKSIPAQYREWDRSPATIEVPNAKPGYFRKLKGS